MKGTREGGRYKEVMEGWKEDIRKVGMGVLEGGNGR